MLRPLKKSVSEGLTVREMVSMVSYFTINQLRRARGGNSDIVCKKCNLNSMFYIIKRTSKLKEKATKKNLFCAKNDSSA